jgi:phenylpyruvate tautomerase PptA (4-oxalocrotonate tautomerase family)
MPLVRIAIPVELDGIRQEGLLRGVSRAVSVVTGKPEKHVMVVLEHAAVMRGGRRVRAAFADVRSIGGIDAETNAELTGRLCKLLHQAAGIAPHDVYVTFTDVPPQNWGCDGRTFG